MISDYAVPAACQPSRSVERRTAAPAWIEGRFTPAELSAILRHLETAGREALDRLDNAELLAAWEDAVDELIEPTSAVRRALDPPLRQGARLSQPALQAGLESLLAGYRGAPVERLVARAKRMERRSREPVALILPANVPGIAVQALLPALALRRPVLLRSSRREPLLAAALVHSLAERRRELAQGLAAMTWPHDDDLTGVLLSRAGGVVAFGTDPTLASIAARRPDVIDHGSLFSVAVVSADADPERTASGIARDVALFEQRGCLSVRAVLLEGDSEALAGALRRHLAERAAAWPPPELLAEERALLRQIGLTGEMRGQRVGELPLEAGAVVEERGGRPEPGPGLRTVRLHAYTDLAAIGEAIAGLSHRLQGVALAGLRARSLAGALRSQGVSRIVEPGELQRPDALWANGDRHLLERLA